MTRALLGKEFFERRIYFTVGFLLVCAIAALMPRFFAFSYALATTNSKAPADIVADILHNVRSYSSFIETQWCGRGLARALIILALIAGIGTVATERESRTLGLLTQSSLSRSTIVVVKFAVIGMWLSLIALCSVAIVAAASLVDHRIIGLAGLAQPSFVALVCAWAVLALAMLASVLFPTSLKATVFAVGLVIFVAAAGQPFGYNLITLPENIFTADGVFLPGRFITDCAFAFGVGFVALISAIARFQET